MKKTRGNFWIRLAGYALVACAVGAVFFVAVSGVETSADRQGRERLEAALRRSAVACYAAEGVYPPTVDYICDHYGVQIDEERYMVDYVVFAENLMPDITVLERE